jgi:hypothetical protein
MSERPKSASLVVHLLLAVAVLGLVFGVGALVGWGTRARRPPAPEKSAAELPDAEVKKELAACQQELRARKKARALPPAPEDAGRETAAKIEALQKVVHECRVRETLTNAYVCGTIDDHINLYDVLVNGTPCVERAGVEEFLIKSLDKCAEFDDFPAHLDEDKLTQVEKDRLVQSKWRRAAAVRTDNYMLGHVQELRRRCRKMWTLPDE